MFRLYELAIRAYGLIIGIAAFFNPKAKAWIAGRKAQKATLQGIYKDIKADIWFHCASLGEFEQGRPLIEGIRREFPDAHILLTFFSPSGYEIRKDYSLVDVVGYLPLDTKSKMQRFIDLVKPGCAVFIKYEFWYRALQLLDKKQTPIYLVSGLFHSRQIFFRWYGSFFRTQLKRFNHLYVQDAASAHLLKNAGLDRVTIAGDTRVDRVIANNRAAVTFPEIETFLRDRKTFVLGSTWPADEALLKPLVHKLINNNWAIIWAPHEIDETHINNIQSSFPNKTCTWTELAMDNNRTGDILIIDSVGKLSQLYQFSQVTYIGGAFGKGLHNILEPIAFKQGVIFGPKYENFREAVELITLGAAISISTEEQLEQAFNHFAIEENKSKIQYACQTFLEKHRGATQLILPELIANFEKNTQ